MTEQADFKIAFSPPLEARLDAYFLSKGMGTNMYALRQDRRDILLWLNAHSDAELAEMGLTREGIPAFVFRDVFGD